MKTITNADIRALKNEAEHAGDDVQCVLCLHALEGEGPLDVADYPAYRLHNARVHGMTPTECRVKCETAIEDACDEA